MKKIIIIALIFITASCVNAQDMTLQEQEIKRRYLIYGFQKLYNR